MFDSHTLCQDYPKLSTYINFCEYTVLEITLVLIGTIFWNIVYYIIIRDAFKNKYVEMPLPAAASNLAWEFAWGFLVTTDMGLVFVWGLRIWFFMDLFIFYTVLKYGDKQLSIPLLKKYFKPIEIIVVLAWIVVFYFFVKEGYDTSMGATSAYVITVIMATLYITFYLSSDYPKAYSFTASWCKGLGNLLMSIFVFSHYPKMYFLQSLTVVVFILNVIYVVLLWQRDKNKNTS
ncbi:MAG: hypothetical protein AAFX87_19940 [Bacteroidota bacterium]